MKQDGMKQNMVAIHPPPKGGGLLATVDKSYSAAVAKYPILKKKQEERLFKVLKNSKSNPRASKKAFEILMYSNQRFILFCAKKYNAVYFATNFADLVSYGNIGLCKAIRRFNPKRGKRLSTWAVPYIVREMSDCVKFDLSVVHGSKHWSIKKTRAIMPIPLSLDEKLEEGCTLGEAILDKTYKSDIANSDARITFQDALSFLNKKDKDIIDLFFRKQYTLEKVGNVHNLSKEGVRQRIVKIIKIIKENLVIE